MPKAPGKSKSALRRQRLKEENPEKWKAQTAQEYERIRKKREKRREFWNSGTKAAEEARLAALQKKRLVMDAIYFNIFNEKLNRSHTINVQI